MNLPALEPGADGLTLAALGGVPFGTVLADPPWRFQNRTGKVAPEHRRLSRYDTMTWKDIAALPVMDVMARQSHCYLWVPNALIAEGLAVMEAWGFTYKSMIVWAKRRKDGGPDGRGVGFYFRNVTEPVLFGVRGKLRTLEPGRRQVNMIETQKREHSRKPDELYPIIEDCSPGPRLEMFARYPQDGWTVWGNEASPDVTPRPRHRTEDCVDPHREDLPKVRSLESVGRHPLRHRTRPREPSHNDGPVGRWQPCVPSRRARLFGGRILRAGSDNLIPVSEITATEAARSFAGLLDAVEHRGERFTIVRRGKAIASLEPMKEGHGADVKDLLRRHRPDSEWSQDLAAVRSGVELQERS